MASKLLRLKNWLPLQDASNHLSGVLEEKVTSNDLIQLAVEGHLTLSVILTEQIEATPYQPITTSEPDSLDSRLKQKREKYEIPEKLRNAIEVGYRAIWTYEEENQKSVPNFADFQLIEGLWDLPTTRANLWCLNAELHKRLTTAQLPTPPLMSGPITLRQPTTGNIFGLIQSRQKDNDTEWSDKKSWAPIKHLPANAHLALSVKNLNRFIEQLQQETVSEPDWPAKPMDPRTEHTYLQIIRVLMVEAGLPKKHFKAAEILQQAAATHKVAIRQKPDSIAEKLKAAIELKD